MDAISENGSSRSGKKTEVFPSNSEAVSSGIWSKHQ
jgi:hypothetical protein